MGAPRTTVWAIEPRTQAKHEILDRYLQAWTAILSLGKFPAIASTASPDLACTRRARPDHRSSL